MKDGLYRIETPHVCAGFVIERGRLKRCAPILFVKGEAWLLRRIASGYAQWVGP